MTRTVRLQITISTYYDVDVDDADLSPLLSEDGGGFKNEVARDAANCPLRELGTTSCAPVDWEIDSSDLIVKLRRLDLADVRITGIELLPRRSPGGDEG